MEIASQMTNIRKSNQQNKKAKYKMQWEQIDKEGYNSIIQNSITSIETEKDVNIQLDMLVEAMTKAGKKTIPTKLLQTKGPKWKASPEVLIILNACREIYKKWQSVGKTKDHVLAIDGNEDVTHFLTTCPILSTTREKYFSEIREIITYEITAENWNNVFKNKAAISQLIVDFGSGICRRCIEKHKDEVQIATDLKGELREICCFLDNSTEREEAGIVTDENLSEIATMNDINQVAMSIDSEAINTESINTELVSDSIYEEGLELAMSVDSDIWYNASFPCFDPNCILEFKKEDQLLKHLSVGKHVVDDEKQDSIIDTSKRLWSAKCQDIRFNQPLISSVGLEQLQDQTKTNINEQHGYALKKRRKAVRFSPKVKDYLAALFNAGELSGKKPSPYTVSK
ncbi:unnamed protein product [Mytilus edulis]|uniref:C2H2-type domain-containing protein n=1 Tax=Mytilus edulis TaxID=6550 RepID=A0A8S3SA16_MYTED|nr:unnamed protein product [Mytilus edulis]